MRYSSAFKHEVIKEIEEGRRTMKEARLAYGIAGNCTIRRWMERMGRFKGLPRIVRVEKPEEKKQIQELQRQIKELKEALAETQVHRVIAESRFEVVCEQQGWDPEEVKKKLQEKPSSKAKRKK